MEVKMVSESKNKLLDLTEAEFENFQKNLRSHPNILIWDMIRNDRDVYQ